MPYRNIRWVKLEFLDLLTDPEHRFIEQLNDEQKGLYLELLLLMGYFKNSIPTDPKTIKRVLNLSEKPEKIAENLDKICEVFSRGIRKSQFVKFKNYNKLHNRLGNSVGTPGEYTGDTVDKNIDKNRIDEILTYFKDHYKQRFNTTYIVNWGKDGKLVKGLLKELSPEEIKGAVDNFFSSQDKFILGSDYSIGFFKYVINKLRVSKTTYI